jgi:hypothetical protein
MLPDEKGFLVSLAKLLIPLQTGPHRVEWRSEQRRHADKSGKLDAVTTL